TTGFLNWVECANHARVHAIRDGVTTATVATPTTWKRKHSGSPSLDCWNWLAANAPHACAPSRIGSNAIVDCWRITSRCRGTRFDTSCPPTGSNCTPTRSLLESWTGKCPMRTRCRRKKGSTSRRLMRSGDGKRERLVRAAKHMHVVGTQSAVEHLQLRAAGI